MQLLCQRIFVIVAIPALFVAAAFATTSSNPASAERLCADVTVHATDPPPYVTACVPLPSTSSSLPPTTLP